MDSLFYLGDAESRNCEVGIDDTSIAVSYEEDDGWVTYSGRNDGSGHFRLRADRNDGQASLHMFPDGKVLDGYWTEHGERGMWRIELKE